MHERCLRALQEAQHGHTELSVHWRCPGSPLQACRVRTESGNSRIDVAKIVFDEYLDEKVTYDINTIYKCRIYVLSVFAENMFLFLFSFYRYCRRLYCKTTISCRATSQAVAKSDIIFDISSSAGACPTTSWCSWPSHRANDILFLQCATRTEIHKGWDINADYNT